MRSQYQFLFLGFLILLLFACTSRPVVPSESLVTEVGEFVQELPPTEAQAPIETQLPDSEGETILEQEVAGEPSDFFTAVPIYETPNVRVDDPLNYNITASIPPDGIRPIYEPRFVPAVNAPLNDDELVIGIAWGGEAKAYSITVLRFREMVNDEMAGIPTLVTW